MTPTSAMTLETISISHVCMRDGIFLSKETFTSQNSALEETKNNIEQGAAASIQVLGYEVCKEVGVNASRKRW